MQRFSRLIYLLGIYAFLYIPIIVLICYSFNTSQQSLIWHGFTWDWYKQLLQNKSLQLVALNSLLIASLAASFATILGTIAAVCLYKYNFFAKRLVHTLIFMLVISPDIVTGISLLVLFASLKIKLGFCTLLLSHISFCLPFAAVTVYSRLTSSDKNIFEAAKDLGATDAIIFLKIMLPLLWPAILAAWLLSFTLSMDDVVISFFVAGPDFEILPLKIFSLVRAGVKPEINALCSILFVITLTCVLMYHLLNRKKTKC